MPPLAPARRSHCPWTTWARLGLTNHCRALPMCEDGPCVIQRHFGRASQPQRRPAPHEGGPWLTNSQVNIRKPWVPNLTTQETKKQPDRNRRRIGNHLCVETVAGTGGGHDASVAAHPPSRFPPFPSRFSVPERNSATKPSRCVRFYLSFP